MSNDILEQPKWHSKEEVDELNRRHTEAMTRLVDRIEALQTERDGIDEERRAALALCLKRNAEISELRAELRLAREAALEEAAKVAEGMPFLRPISTAHVKSTTPKDVAAAIRTLQKREVGDE